LRYVPRRSLLGSTFDDQYSSLARVMRDRDGFMLDLSGNISWVIRLIQYTTVLTIIYSTLERE